MKGNLTLKENDEDDSVVEKIVRFIAEHRGAQIKDSEVTAAISDHFGAWHADKARKIATNVTFESGISGEFRGHNPNMDDGGPGNEFYQAYWNALMAYNLGGSRAKAFGDAHEQFDEEQLNSLAHGYPVTQHVKMDLYNNAVGRGIASRVPNFNDVDNPVFAADQILLDRYGSQEAVDS